jgi:hypothetical protein
MERLLIEYTEPVWTISRILRKCPCPTVSVKRPSAFG